MDSVVLKVREDIGSRLESGYKRIGRRLAQTETHLNPSTPIYIVPFRFQLSKHPAFVNG